MRNPTIIDLVTIAKAFAVATGRKESAVSAQYLGSSHRLTAIESGISDVGANMADNYIQKMSDNWPTEVIPPLALLNWRHRQMVLAHSEYSHSIHYNGV